MNLSQFIKRWVQTYGSIEFNLNMNSTWGCSPRRHEFEEKYREQFYDDVKSWEPLYHPIVAIQEAQQQFIELQKDFNALWSKIMEGTIPLQGVIG